VFPPSAGGKANEWSYAVPNLVLDARGVVCLFRRLAPNLVHTAYCHIELGASLALLMPLPFRGTSALSLTMWVRHGVASRGEAPKEPVCAEECLWCRIRPQHPWRENSNQDKRTNLVRHRIADMVFETVIRCRGKLRLLFCTHSRREKVWSSFRPFI